MAFDKEVVIRVKSEADLAAIKAFGAEIVKVEDAADGAGKATDKASKGVDNASDSAKRGKKSMGEMADALEKAAGKGPEIGVLTGIMRDFGPAVIAGFAVTAITAFLDKLKELPRALGDLENVDLGIFQKHFEKLAASARDFKREIDQVAKSQASFLNIEEAAIEAERRRKLVELDEGGVDGAPRRAEVQRIEEDAIRKRAALKVRERKQELELARRAEVDKTKSLNRIEEERAGLQFKIATDKARQEALKEIDEIEPGLRALERASPGSSRGTKGDIRQRELREFVKSTTGFETDESRENAAKLLEDYNQAVAKGQDELDRLAASADLLSQSMDGLNRILEQNVLTDVRKSEMAREKGDASDQESEQKKAESEEQRVARENAAAAKAAGREAARVKRESIRDAERRDTDRRSAAREGLGVASEVAGAFRPSSANQAKSLKSFQEQNSLLAQQLVDEKNTTAELEQAYTRIAAALVQAKKSKTAEGQLFRIKLEQIEAELQSLR